MMAHLCVSVYDHLQNRRSISRRKLAFYLCLQEFPGQTNHPECTSGNEGRREMGKQFSVETAVCTEHQRLLEGCQRALEIWNERPRFSDGLNIAWERAASTVASFSLPPARRLIVGAEKS